MLKIKINKGGIPLKGKINISGAKNAALPLMVASLLTDEPIALDNAPALADVRTMSNLLGILGVSVDCSGSSMKLTAKDICSTTAAYDLVKKMRASVLVLGPLLARAGQAKVSLPGGCAIGVRPINLHIRGLQTLGAEIDLQDGYITAKAPNGLKGGAINFDVPTVTGTENIMMAAVLAKGITTIVNAACEPEVVDLAKCLNSMGARIHGQGTQKITIEGVDKLHGTKHKIIYDRIETGTYAIAAAITRGEIELIGEGLGALMLGTADVFEQAGISIKKTELGLMVSADKLYPVSVSTEPFPGFPTDLQAQIMALMCVTKGTSVVTENIWENRFLHVPELCRMGADITLKGTKAVIKGVRKLQGAPVMATDLRASFGLVLAGLAADGTTVIDRTYHLVRGYENAVGKLQACGADIEEFLSNKSPYEEKLQRSFA
ncbi:MAG: UDP-N-acetylglucosamine 1-carboxyvinyltransferase [Holosporales bacterium]|nr:UDP-N-acetylglucosamine 1-carboxyvinyltransferase [Holosporales bacterium]